MEKVSTLAKAQHPAFGAPTVLVADLAKKASGSTLNRFSRVLAVYSRLSPRHYMHISRTITKRNGQTFEVILDAEDGSFFDSKSWHVVQKGKLLKSFYVRESTTNAYLHRMLIGASSSDIIDHKNANSLDNQKANLRRCDAVENMRNCRTFISSKSSIYKGVSWSSRGQNWRTSLYGTHAGKSIRLFDGYFASEFEAAKAYDQAAKELFGQFARFNFPDLVVKGA